MRERHYVLIGVVALFLLLVVGIVSAQCPSGYTMDPKNPFGLDGSIKCSHSWDPSKPDVTIPPPPTNKGTGGSTDNPPVKPPADKKPPAKPVKKVTPPKKPAPKKPAATTTETDDDADTDDDTPSTAPPYPSGDPFNTDKGKDQIQMINPAPGDGSGTSGFYFSGKRKPAATSSLVVTSTAPTPPEYNKVASSIPTGGDSFTRSSKGVYKNSAGDQTMTVNADGSVTWKSAAGTQTYPKGSTIANNFKNDDNAHVTNDKLKSDYEKKLADFKKAGGKTEDKKATEEADKGTGKARKSSKGDKPVEDPKLTEYQKIDWTRVKEQIAAAGGWYNFLFKGPFTGTFTTLGAAWFGEGEDRVKFGNYLTINHWAESICDSKLEQDGGSGGPAFITSPSGQTYAHMEGERIYIDPCQGVQTVAQNISCTPYYAYRISGAISAAEIEMDFSVYLKQADTGTQYNLYPNSTRIKLDKGGMLSLAGANMYYFEQAVKYEWICIHFYNQEQLWNLFGAQLSGDDNPMCQRIVDGKEYDYQQYKTSTGGWITSPGGAPAPASPLVADPDSGIPAPSTPGLSAG